MSKGGGEREPVRGFQCLWITTIVLLFAQPKKKKIGSSRLSPLSNPPADLLFQYQMLSRIPSPATISPQNSPKPESPLKETNNIAP